MASADECELALLRQFHTGNAITATGYKSLNEGDKVQFEVEKGPKGPSAKNVSIAE